MVTDLMQRLPEQSQCLAPGSHQNQQQPLQESQLGLLAWGQVFCLASWGRASLAAALSMLALAVGSCLQLRHRYLRQQQIRCQQFVHTNKVREPLCETAFHPAPSAAGQTDAYIPGQAFLAAALALSALMAGACLQPQHWCLQEIAKPSLANYEG